MFKTKYTISLLDSKWQQLKRNFKVDVIPRANEFIYLNDGYYKVLNVVHTLNNKQEIFVIIEQITQEISVDNQ
jgi:hypothetical protein